ncbi:MAG: hypothetical protein Q7W45_07360 [Bacteroidota bacterium]|nr:hypothetical protein [Bacteroidota bacterium]MDP3143959.1 hypothetical protein [Bacteroidota bacterium]
MKKLIQFVFTFIALTGFSQEIDTWRIGVQWGFHGNRAEFSGGMPNANARFHQNKFDGGAFNVEARYDLDKHWMGTIGLGINSFGFQYALAENYSLYHPKNHFSGIKSDFTALDVPLMIFYKFNPNCKNAKWLVGLGVSQNFVGTQTISRNFEVANDGSTNSNYLNSISSTNGGAYTMLRFAIAREKVFKRGNILNASFLFNAGFRQLAKSTVNYTVDGQNYTHDFTTNGNFAGFRLTYFFRPLQSKPTAKTSKVVKS